MNKLTLLLLFPLLVISCRKGQPDARVTGTHQLKDFYIIPVRDARWKIVCHGTYVGGATGYVMDTNYHFSYDITCTGKDTMTNGKRYWKYGVAGKEFYPNRTTKVSEQDGTIYLREDTATNSVYQWMVIGNTTNPPEYLVANYNYHVGDTVFWQVNGGANIVESLDSVLVDDQYFKVWNSRIISNHQLQFFQGIGIGTQWGILFDPYIGNGAKTTTLDFYYKSDSLHYDFDEL